jgi:3'-phosphoadenosine 5'-phosphosulfate sulfotransferase (PAPS reductase)/FAD synthetase
MKTKPTNSLPAAVMRILRKARKRNTTWVTSGQYAPTLPRPDTINHIGCSGGKDSTALLLWAIHESGYPRETLDVSFCDTGNEAPATYEYLDYLEDALQIGITRIKPELDFFELSRKKKRFPSARARFCTEELKIVPTTDYIHHLGRSAKTLVLGSAAFRATCA